jgi:hypothetical protein
VLPPQDQFQYVAALDVGTRRDMTGFAVCHVEARPSGRTVVVDRVIYWRPVRGRRVDLDEVQQTVLRLCREYRARLRFDRMQAEQLSSNLSRQGVTVKEFTFSSSSTTRMARTLHAAIRDRAIEVPDDPELLDELMSTRMVETGAGVKLADRRGHHDDLVQALGMCAVDLLESTPSGPSSVLVPRGSIQDAQRRPPVTALGMQRRNEPAGLQAARAGARQPASRAGLPVGVADRLAALKARR